MNKFKLPSYPSSTSKSIRFPNRLIEQVEEKIKGTPYTFSSFVIQALQFALENYEETDSQE